MGNRTVLQASSCALSDDCIFPAVQYIRVGMYGMDNKRSLHCKRQQCRAVSVALMVMEPSSRDSRFVIFCSPLKNWAHPAET